jgi:hypothetical protein
MAATTSSTQLLWRPTPGDPLLLTRCSAGLFIHSVPGRFAPQPLATTEGHGSDELRCIAASQLVPVAVDWFPQQTSDNVVAVGLESGSVAIMGVGPAAGLFARRDLTPKSPRPCTQVPSLLLVLP